MILHAYVSLQNVRYILKCEQVLWGELDKRIYTVMLAVKCLLKNRVYYFSLDPVCAYLYLGACANYFVALQILLTRVYILGSRCHKMQNRIWNELVKQ